MPTIKDLILLYVRYIDDIFFVWKGTEEELKKFLETVNDLHPSNMFDYVYSKSKSVFLDCNISLNGRKLKTLVFSKPTDRKAYVHSKSYHPQATKEAIAYGQALRLRRICTEEADFWKLANKLESDLIKRGYDKNKIAGEIRRAASKERQSLRTYKEKTKDQRIPLVLTYDDRLPNVREIMDDSWKLLHINETERRKFTEKPRLCYRRNRNLCDILGQTKLSNGKVNR